jgi:ribosomal protein L31E
MTRERFEQNLSSRSKKSKSLAQLQNERVMTEMNRAVFGDGTENVNNILSLHRDGVSIGQIKEAINLECARTEKYNQYVFTDGHDSPKSKIRLQLELGDTIDKKSHASLLNDLNQLEREKREFA